MMNLLFKPLPQISLQLFFSECNHDNSCSDHISGKTESTLMPATHAQCKEDSYSSSVSVRTSDIVRFVDPDTKENGRFLVVSWAGKTQGQYHNWFHVKNLDNGMLSQSISVKQSGQRLRRKFTIMPAILLKLPMLRQKN